MSETPDPFRRQKLIKPLPEALEHLYSARAALFAAVQSLKPLTLWWEEAWSAGERLDDAISLLEAEIEKGKALV